MTFTGKGGRGHKAPYSTIHYRIPVTIKPIVEKLAYKFKEIVDNYLEVEELLNRVDQAIDNNNDENQAETNKLFEQLEFFQSEVVKLKEEKAIAFKVLREALAVKGNKAGEVKSLIRKAYPDLEEEEG